MNNELTILLVATFASIAGSFFSIWRKGKAGSVVNGLTLIAISASLAVWSEHSLIGSTSLPTYLALAIGLSLGLAFPCCMPRQRVGITQVVASLIVLAHCVLDGHIIKEVSSLPLAFLLIAHKFQDGADVRLLGSDNAHVQKLFRLLLIAATPIGFFFIPEEIVNPMLHNALFAAVIGLNLGSGFHLLRHAVTLHLHPHTHSHATN